MTIHVSDIDFDALIADNEFVLVDCFATWCGPCKRIAPIITELADEYEGKVAIAKMDVDRSPRVSSQYGIQAIPTLLYFKGGKLVKTVVGLKTKEQIIEEMMGLGFISEVAPKKPATYSDNVTIVTDANFADFIASGLSIVDCWAPWCGPCRRMGPIIDGLADISVGEIKVGKLDVDENPEVSRKYDIMSIPALLMFKDGKMVDTIIGLDPSLTPEVLKKYMLEL